MQRTPWFNYDASHKVDLRFKNPGRRANFGGKGISHSSKMCCGMEKNLIFDLLGAITQMYSNRVTAAHANVLSDYPRNLISLSHMAIKVHEEVMSEASQLNYVSMFVLEHIAVLCVCTLPGTWRTTGIR